MQEFNIDYQNIDKNFKKSAMEFDRLIGNVVAEEDMEDGGSLLSVRCSSSLLLERVMQSGCISNT